MTPAAQTTAVSSDLETGSPAAAEFARLEASDEAAATFTATRGFEWDRASTSVAVDAVFRAARDRYTLEVTIENTFHIKGMPDKSVPENQSFAADPYVIVVARNPVGRWQIRDVSAEPLEPQHTMFTDAVVNGLPLLAGHTNARWNYPITTIMHDFPKSA
jgi:hypothetical protein